MTTIIRMGLIDKALSTSVEGIHKAIASVSSRAERVSSYASDPENVDLVSEFVGLKLDSYAVGANGKVMKTLFEMEESTLDIIA